MSHVSFGRSEVRGLILCLIMGSVVVTGVAAPTAKAWLDVFAQAAAPTVSVASGASTVGFDTRLWDEEGSAGFSLNTLRPGFLLFFR